MVEGLGTAVMTGHHLSGTDGSRVAAALSSDIIVIIQGDEPIIAGGLLIRRSIARPSGDQMATFAAA